MSTKNRLPTIEELIASEKKKPVPDIERFKIFKYAKEIEDVLIDEAVDVANTWDRKFFNKYPNEVFLFRQFIIGEIKTQHPCNAVISVSIHAKKGARIRIPLDLKSNVEVISIEELVDYCIASLTNMRLPPFLINKVIKKLERYKRKYRKHFLKCDNFEQLSYQKVIEALSLKDIKSSELTFLKNMESGIGHISISQEAGDE